MKLRQDNELAAYLVAIHLDIDIRGTPYTGLVIERGDTAIGAVVFNDYAQGNVEMTGVGVACWSPHIIRELARYVFGQLGCNRVTARTAVNNHKARDALRALGFVQEGRVREWFGDQDAIVYGLLRREQRILK